MQILVVGHDIDLARIWAGQLSRQGLTCTVVADVSAAFDALRAHRFGAIVLDLEMPNCEAFCVADFAAYRDSDIPILAVTARAFFSEGSIFELIPNVCGCLSPSASPDDMAAMVEHYGNRHLLAEHTA